ncbi:AzlD domain-containing protein [Amnibacterium setariae]|uniref:Branched-chain amino acid ABC transporter n=1 Tax=Amnibacterium setariae TaxID=2306585 RepID=A0A3A1TWN6_9MICO|nr:AzlD domain-containing protein [Amnibacterium setariae]RIX26558.1 branched-chain amino acid ABC transporter [Amnibacterium setariae]
MTAVVWVCITAAALISAAIKGVGPALLGARPLPRRVRAVVAVIAPALVAALVVVEVVGPRWSAFDPLVVAGVVVAVAARLLRAPMLVAVLAAALATAGLRLLL